MCILIQKTITWPGESKASRTFAYKSPSVPRLLLFFGLTG